MFDDDIFDNPTFDTDFDTNFDAPDDADLDRTNIPFRVKPTRPIKVMYENALKMAKDITPEKGMSYYTIVKGSFVFGDFIEALTQVHKLQIEELYVSTLGMSENNIDSLVNLIQMYGAKVVNLIVSRYFYGVERGNKIPYLAGEAAGLPFNVAVAGSHAKVTCIKANGLYLVMHGSANLSSNTDIEQFMIQEDEDLYNYNTQIFSRIMRKHTIISGSSKSVSFSNARKSLHTPLWKTMQGE